MYTSRTSQRPLAYSPPYGPRAGTEAEPGFGRCTRLREKVQNEVRCTENPAYNLYSEAALRRSEAIFGRDGTGFWRGPESFWTDYRQKTEFQKTST